MGPSLKFFAGLWTLRDYLVDGRIWTLADKFAEVKRRGFSGIGGRFDPDAPALCAEYALDYILYIDADAHDYEEQLRRALDWMPRRINVQLCDHDTTPEQALAVWIKMEALALELGLDIDLELHRDTATETPEKAYAIAALFLQATGRPIRFGLDFSHFAVTKHLVPPYAARLLDHPELFSSVRQLHLRPFNGHHAQVPATNGQGVLSAEMCPYLEFIEVLFKTVMKTAKQQDVFYACPENGPKDHGGYALACFPDPWLDAIRVRDEVAALWIRQGGTLG
ncbi:MAG: xylose isomerase [Opitutus sp.]